MGKRFFSKKWREEHSKRMTGAGNPRYGIKLSDEIKKRIGEANRNPSEETRRKLSLAASRRIQSEDSNRKRSKALMGRVLSSETLKRMSIAQTGRTFSIKTRKKMSKSGKIKFFSKEHRQKISISNLGDKNHNWKGGITPVYELVRACVKYKEWCANVFKRDNYRCLGCNDDRGGNLNADHIKPFCLIIKEEKIRSLVDISPQSQLWDINNGRTLCVLCHKKTETWGSKVRSWIKRQENQQKIGTLI